MQDVTKVSGEVAAVLDDLAARFGQTGAHLWEELVRHEVAGDIATSIGFVLVTVIVTVVGYVVAGHVDEYDRGGVLGFTWVLSGLLAILSVVSLVITAATLIAPEAATLRGLLP